MPPITINIPPEAWQPRPAPEPVAPLALPPPAVPSSLQRPDLPPVVQERAAELDQLDQEFSGSDTVVIVGKGGQGKSTFANLYATRWLERGRGMLLWYDAERGKLSGDQIVGYALAALGWHEGVDYRRADYKLGELGGLLADRVTQADANWLLVVSGLDESDCYDSGLLRDPELNTLLERGCQGLADSRLLLTARDRVRHGGKFRQPAYYRLDLLDPAASYDLLRGSLQQPERFAEGKLWQAVGKGYADGYPHALTLLINALNNSPLDDVAAYLDELLAKPRQWYNEQQDGGVLLDGIWAGLARRDGLERTVQYVAIFQRSATAADLSGMLAAMQPPVSFDGASLRQPALRDLLEQSKVGDQTAYNLHPLLGSYALDKQGEQATVAHRAAAARYLQASYFAAHDPHSKPPRTVENVQPLLDAFDQLTAVDDYETAFKLMFINVEQGQEQLHLYDKLYRWGEARRLTQMWEVLAESSKLTTAQQGVVIGNLGNSYRSLGEYRKALGYYEQALPIFEQIGDERGKGNILSNLGSVYRNLGEYHKAINYYEQALPIFEQIGDERGKDNTLTNLGNGYAELGECHRAIGYYEQALQIAEQISDQQGKGNALGNLGNVYADLGEYHKGIDYHERHLQITKQIGDLWGEGYALGNLGMAYANLGEYHKAINYLEQALQVDEQFGNLLGLSKVWNNMGLVYEMLRLYRDALACYLKSQLTRVHLGNPHNIVTIERNITNIRMAVGEGEWFALLVKAERLAADERWRPTLPLGVDAAGGEGRLVEGC